MAKKEPGYVYILTNPRNQGTLKNNRTKIKLRYNENK